jgi:hypothetical protein
VKAYLPGSQPGDTYILQAEDGGFFPGQKLKGARAVNVDQAGQLGFDFQVSDQNGIYRVVLRSGGSVNVFNF